MAIKAQGDGQLTGTKATLYTTPSEKQAIVRNIWLVNTSLSIVRVNIYVKPGSTSRRIIPKHLQLRGGYSAIIDGPFTLEAGDLIEGDASNATTIELLINGVEESS